MSIWYQTDDHKIHQIDYDELIEKIDLTDRKIQKIIKINGLTNLQKLNLSKNQITHINGLERLSALQHLNLSLNQITNIGGLELLTALQYLDLSNNQITHIRGLERLTALQHLDLSNNQITHIRGLERLTALQHLDLSFNQITRIEGMDCLIALQRLWLSKNQITRIEGIEQLTVLRQLGLSYNQITHIRGLEQLTALQYLDLTDNQITRIEGLEKLTAIRQLYLDYNPIKEVPITIMLLKNLSCLSVDIEYDPIIQRFLTRNQIKSNRKVYDDRQNVHDSQINRSISQSLYRLMEQKIELSEEKAIGEILDDQILTKRVKEQIVAYVRITDVHSSVNVTFSEALRAVWQIIRTHRESEEIKRILNQEIDDSYCKCFTGRLSRLVNCLNGFDERVSVRISDQQDIANIIISIRQKTDNLLEQQQMIQHEMTDRGYDLQTVREWIGYLE
jgi:Leucine-rich repeat (LRR) protein